MTETVIYVAANVFMLGASFVGIYTLWNLWKGNK